MDKQILNISQSLYLPLFAAELSLCCYTQLRQKRIINNFATCKSERPVVMNI